MLGKRRKKTDLPAVCAVIVAAGSSRRMGGENKLLLEIDGVPVLARTLSAFQKCAAIRDIVLVCREQDIMPYTELAKAFSIDKLCTVTRGGETRTESVLAGITAAPENAVLVAVHDGARPLVSEAVITEAVTTAAEYGAAAPVVPVKDSIKRIEDGNIAADVARNTLAAVQTPQVFRKDLLRRALTSAAERGYSFTDDCAAVESLGTIVKAATRTLRSPRRRTFSLRKRSSQGRTSNMRIGHGYDVHRLVSGRPCIIGGVNIPFDLGLDGHSDADVLTHAVMDSLLGALALGDIGKHFPDTDPRYKGADSIALLRHVAALVRESGWQLGNLDATVLAQAPKLAPHILQMRENLAAAIGCAVEQVSVKATTEEGLGFTGSKQGIAAHCVCLLERI